MEYLSIMITAVIGAIVAFLFSRIEKKIDVLETENKARHKEQIEIRMAERDLMLVVADTSILTAKKVNDANSVNGELEKAIEELQKREKRLQALTREYYFQHVDCMR